LGARPAQRRAGRRLGRLGLGHAPRDQANQAANVRIAPPIQIQLTNGLT